MAHVEAVSLRLCKRECFALRSAAHLDVSHVFTVKIRIEKKRYKSRCDTITLLCLENKYFEDMPLKPKSETSLVTIFHLPSSFGFNFRINYVLGNLVAHASRIQSYFNGSQLAKMKKSIPDMYQL